MHLLSDAWISADLGYALATTWQGTKRALISVRTPLVGLVAQTFLRRLEPAAMHL